MTEPISLNAVQTQMLTALVEGYQAREGMKDRIRALNEWELARRAGATDVSYAEFYEHPTREPVLNALYALQRYGLASVWERGVKYDTFVPTVRGEAFHAGDRGAEPLGAAMDAAAKDDARPVGALDADPVVQRLDEIIRLLRSVDAKLGGA